MLDLMAVLCARSGRLVDRGTPRTNCMRMVLQLIFECFVCKTEQERSTSSYSWPKRGCPKSKFNTRSQYVSHSPGDVSEGHGASPGKFLVRLFNSFCWAAVVGGY